MAIRPRGAAVLDSLLRGKGWIALVGVLLAGIVFFNVDVLELNRGIAKDAERASALKRENSVLRTRVAQLGSTERIQRAAARLGLVLPQPGEIRYLRAHPSLDARKAAQSIEAPAPRGAPPPTDNATPDPTPSEGESTPTGSQTAAGANGTAGGAAGQDSTAAGPQAQTGSTAAPSG